MRAGSSPAVAIISLAEAVIRISSRVLLERRLRIRMSRIFRAQRASFPAQSVAARAIEMQRPLVEVAQPKDPDDPLQRLVAASWPDQEDPIGLALMQSGTEAATSGMNYTLALVGHPQADSLAPMVSEWLAQHSLLRARSIEQTSIERIRNILARGVADGRTASQMAKDIRSEFAGWARTSARGRLTPEERAIVRRAQLIAITETTEAWEASSYAVMQASGASGRSWLTAQDERTCEICLANEAAGVLPFDVPFPSGHLYPPAHPADRCTTVPGEPAIPSLIEPPVLEPEPLPDWEGGGIDEAAEDEYDAVYHYTADYGTDLNAELRAGNTLSAKYEETSSLLDRVIAQRADVDASETELFRSLGDVHNMLPRLGVDDVLDLEGLEFMDDAFGSFTKSTDVVFSITTTDEEIGSRLVLRVVDTEGTVRGLDVGTASRFPEDEVIFPRGLRYRIDRVQEEDFFGETVYVADVTLSKTQQDAIEAGRSRPKPIRTGMGDKFALPLSSVRIVKLPTARP